MRRSQELTGVHELADPLNVEVELAVFLEGGDVVAHQRVSGARPKASLCRKSEVQRL